jgi:hypothetical protein
MSSPVADVRRSLPRLRPIWILAAAASLTIVSQSPAQIDGWGSDGGPGAPQTIYTSQSQFGVTSGNSALQTTDPQGNFWGPSTPNLMTNFYSALANARFIRYDLTLINQQLNGGSQFSGFAQNNEMAVQLFSNPGGTFPTQYNQFIQRNFAAANATDTSGQSGTWSGVDGTRTLTWDLSTFTAPDTDGTTKTIGQILMAHPDMQDAKIDFVQQLGGGSAPGNFYWDNVQLLDASGNTLAVIGNFEVVPEPGTMALAALAIPPVIAAIRRRRRAAITAPAAE